MADMRLIDANALMYDVMSLTIVSPEVMNYANAVGLVVANAPTISAVSVVHGRWVAEIERRGNYSHCSECGCRCQGYVPNYKYCPNCGAKMDAKEDGKDV